jgi:hypothetical protein
MKHQIAVPAEVKWNEERWNFCRMMKEVLEKSFPLKKEIIGLCDWYLPRLEINLMCLSFFAAILMLQILLI